MRLNMKTDYCLRVLIYLQQTKKKSKVAEIADFYGISKNHLGVAVNNLSELGYIISTPGPHGGIEFNSEYAKKTVGELVHKLEDFHIVECLNVENNTCTISPQCKLKSMLTKATKSFLAELKNYKIEDLT